jgi:hypothetical protein
LRDKPLHHGSKRAVHDDADPAHAGERLLEQFDLLGGVVGDGGFAGEFVEVVFGK